MEEKEFYTQTEIGTYLGKSLSSLAFYKKELIEKGLMVEQDGKNVITKEGFNYLKLRFAEKRKNNNTDTSNKTLKVKGKKEVKVEVQNQELEVQKDLQDEINKLKLEIQELNGKNSFLIDKNKDLSNQISSWKTECIAWQKNADLANEDKKFWQSFAISEVNNLKDTLLPVVMPTKQKKKFTLFGRK